MPMRDPDLLASSGTLEGITKCITLAAKATGRRCVGIELSPEYARIAAERIKTA